MARRKRQSALHDAFQSVRRILYIPILISLVYGLLRLAGPLFMILMFDRVLPSRSEATLVSLLILLVIILVVMTLLDYSRRRLLARFGAQFQEKVEDRIFCSPARNSYHGRGGSKPAAGLNEADRLRGFFHSGSLVSILDFLWSPVFLAVVFIIHPLIGWIVVAGLAILGLINAVKFHFSKNREARHTEASGGIGKLKERLFTSRHVIESQQMTAAYNRRWLDARRRSRDSALELKDWTAWFSILSSHTALLIQYTALAAAAYLTIKGELTIGTMVASMYLARLVFFPAERIMKQVPNIRDAIENWKNLDKTLGAPAAPTAALEETAPLRLSQLAARCPLTKAQLLKNIDLEITPGSSAEIVGGDGSGKTVLAETLVGRFQKSGGKVLLGAVDFERLPINDAAAVVGYIPQRIDFFAGTIEENIAGLDVEPNRKRLVHVMRLAEMHDKILSLPDGYATAIDTIGSIFSKTERHRLALARALYPSPRLLIVDEPDSHLREALAKGLKQEIADFYDRGGMLLILTRLGLKKFQPNRRFLLEDGRLKETKSEPQLGKTVIRLAKN